MARALAKVVVNEGLTEQEIVASENLVIDAQYLVQEILNERGLTRADLARMTGVSKARLTGLMGSGANPTLRTLAKIFTVLGEELRLDRAKASENQRQCESAESWQGRGVDWGEGIALPAAKTSGSACWEALLSDYKVRLSTFNAQEASNENNFGDANIEAIAA